MKKIMYIMVFAFSAVLLIAFLCILGRPKKTIPLVDGLYWDASPKQVSQILGDSNKIIVNSCDTGKNEYQYKTRIFGEEATIVCFFLNENCITDIYITWDNCSPTVYEKVYECLYSYYCNNKYFFVEEGEEIKNDYSYCRIGTNNGTTGIFYEIKKTDTVVSVTCINNS